MGDACTTASASRRIFISYGHDALSGFAFRLRKDLTGRGHQVWLDEDRIRAGLDWERKLEEGLKRVAEDSNGKFILLMTPHSVRRPDGYCLNELSLAISKNIRIVPIMLSMCEPPLSISRIHWLDMTDCNKPEEREEIFRAKLTKLFDAIENDRIEYDGLQASLVNMLKPLSFEPELEHVAGKFVGREWIADDIKAWLSFEKGPRVFWITGSPGTGKTSLAAWLCANEKKVIAYHFCRYDNAQRIDVRRWVMSIAYQLSVRLPDYGIKLREARLEEIGIMGPMELFDNLIIQPLSGMTPPAEPCCLLVDGLDEAASGDKNELACFLASELDRAPRWLRMIVTSRPDPDVKGYLQAYDAFNIDLDDERNLKDIRKYLIFGIAHRCPGIKPTPAIIDDILEKSEGLFLYVEWIINELEQGRLRIEDAHNCPKGLKGIFLLYFKRQFPNLRSWGMDVRPPLEALAASQEPLDLRTIGRVFGWDIYDERRFVKSLGSLFTVEKGTVRPFHKSLMEWLTDDNKHDPYFVSVEEGHRLLAEYGYKEYMAGKSLSTYALFYLPHHLCVAGMMDELGRVLSDLKFIVQGWEKDRFHVMKYWTLAEERSGLRMNAVYCDIISNPANANVADLSAISGLLQSASYMDEAIKAYDGLIGRYRESGDVHGLQVSLGRLASMMLVRSEYDRAMSLLKEQEEACRRLDDKKSLADCLCAQAGILYRKSSLDEAMALLNEQESVCRSMGNKDGLQVSLNLQAEILLQRGDLDRAMACWKEQENISRETGNMEGLQSSLGSQGVIHYYKGDTRKALSLLKKQERICREIGNRDGLQQCLGNQGAFHLLSGEPEKALELVREQETICRRLGNKYGLQVCLGNMAVMLRNKGDLDASLARHKEEEAICRELGEFYGLQACIGNQALIRRWKGEIDEAERLFAEQGRICKEMGFKDGIASSLGNRALILRMKGQYDKAMSMHKEEEAIGREISDMLRVATSIGNQGVIMRDTGEDKKALSMFKEQERICREMGYKDCLATSLGEQGALFLKKGDVDTALALFGEEEAIYQQLNNLYGLQASYGRQSEALAHKKDMEGADKKSKEKEQICQKLGISTKG